jgi:tetratricopeptide (TPR) repeat protein
MKEIKKFYIGACLIALIVFCSCLMGQKVLNLNSAKLGQGDAVFNTDYGYFLAAQHALDANDFNAASEMVNAIKTENKVIAETQTLADFFNGQIPKNASKLKDSKDLVNGLVYDAFLIQKDDWKSVYERHTKDSTVFAAPLRIFAGVKQGKTKEVQKYIDSLSTSEYWKAFVRGQIAVLKGDVDAAAKEFAKVHPEFMNINDYLYLMSFYRENGMTADMDILRNDFLAKPGGMYVVDYPEIPDWSNYAGYKNNLVFAIVQNISHTQIMIHTDLSLLFLRFAQIISNEANMDAINYYLGQYYFYNTGDYKTCFESIKKTSPLYIFGQLNIAERDGDIKTIKKIVHKNPLFVPGIQNIVRQSIKNGRKNDALRVLNRALRSKGLSDGGRAYFLNQRAHVYLMFGNAKRAQKDLYESKILGGSMNADFISLQARAWVLQDSNLDDAYNSAMLLIKNNTSDVFAWDILGQVVAKRESVDSALEIIETVVSKGAQLSMIYEHLGDMYAIQGDKERALRSYHQALDLSEDCMIVVPVVKKKIRKIK